MSKRQKVNQRPHLIPALIAAAMLLGALTAVPYGYYQFLRLVVCGVGAYVAYTAYNWEKMWVIWPFGFIAILFNPFTPIHLSREVWQQIDVVCAFLFALVAFVLKKPKD